MAQSWFRKGDSDIKTTEALLKAEGPYDTACFHSQQAVEKYLKGFIEFHEDVAPRIHDLVELNQRCAAHNASRNIDENVLAELTNYAVESRYQLDFLPDRQLAVKASSEAQQICRIILDAQKKINIHRESAE